MNQLPSRPLGIYVFALSIVAATSPSLAQGPQIADPADVDKDYEIQGEYVGEVAEGSVKVGVQVIALGNGKFQSAGYVGGLPGAGWTGEERHLSKGERQDGVVRLDGDQAVGIVEDGVLKINDLSGNPLGELKPVIRSVKSMGAKPPEGAKVLASVDDWEGAGRGEAKMTDGLLHQGANSKERFQNCHVHIEFRLPYAPQRRGQARGNSGIYLQGRYEVQMLDSFGLEGKHNECGGIYEIRDPDVNMCLPPLQWQVYDIDFTAAKFDAQGNKTNNARITVRHNDVVIHKDVELPRATRAAPLKEGPEPGFIHLQDHGNPVRYRNIWVVEKQ